MNPDEKKATDWLVVVLSLVSAIGLALVHILWSPADDNRLGVLVIDMIPSAIVVLLAFPVAFTVLIRMGVRVSPLQRTDSEQESQDRSASSERRLDSEGESTSSITRDLGNLALSDRKDDNGIRDIFVVVNMQRDFFKGGALPVPNAESLLEPLNHAIDAAERAGALIVFTQDWHPPNHVSFKEVGGVRPAHCVQGTMGAKLHPDLAEPRAHELIRFGNDQATAGNSPLENPLLVDLISETNVREVIVAGLATEYCVLATCLDTISLRKSVCVIEKLVRAMYPRKLKQIWSVFDKNRIRHVTDFSWPKPESS